MSAGAAAAAAAAALNAAARHALANFISKVPLLFHVAEPGGDLLFRAGAVVTYHACTADSKPNVNRRWKHFDTF